VSICGNDVFDSADVSRFSEFAVIPSHLFSAALLALTIVAGVGCDSRRPSSSDAGTSEESTTALQKVSVGHGIVRGRVTFTGTPPPMKEVADAQCHPGERVTIRDESVVVNADGTLRNVFVFLKGVSTDVSTDVAAPVLDQVGCTYVPHVIGVQAGRPLTVKTSDATPHNVHFTPSKNRAGNLNMVNAGDTRQLTFAMPEFIRFKCDVHPWMAAYVGVFPHPFFATTGEAGTFELKNLPAGTFTLVAWHERFGEIEKQVTIDEAKPVEVDFNFAP
jgi:plastocyanin